MNQPTDDRMKKIEERQEDFDKRLKNVEQQQTEEIRAIRVEVASEDVLNRLKVLEQGQQELKQEITRRIDSAQENTNVLKIEMQGARGDILQIRESQADLRDRLIKHSEDLKVMKDTQDTHSELLGQLITIGESHTERFDRIDANMATKEDVASLKSDFSALMSTQERQEQLMQEILNRLPEKP